MNWLLFWRRRNRDEKPRDRFSWMRSTPPVDDGFDTTGFLVGLASGIPISPEHGVSTGAILGAAMHQNNDDTTPEQGTPSSTPDSTPSHHTSSHDSGYTSPNHSHDSGSSSYDSGSSSSLSSDSGSSSSDSGSSSSC